MTNKLVPCVVFVGVALTTAACQSMGENRLKTISAGYTGCTPDQLTITKLDGTHFGGNEMWNATCNGKVYLCSGEVSGDHSCAPVAK
jgi:hypothetical protein